MILRGEYIDLIPSPILTTSPDLIPKIEVKLLSIVEIELPQETSKPTSRTKISQLVFMPSPSLKETTSNAQLQSE